MTVNDDSRHYDKAALLNGLKAACEDRKLDAVALTPDEIPNRAALIAALSPRTWRSTACPAARPRGAAPARLRLAPAGPVAARHLERRHPLADGPRARPREAIGTRTSTSLMLRGAPEYRWRGDP